MRKFLILISVILLSSWAVAAQTDTLRLGYSVRGTVVDADSGRPLESAHVSVPGRHHATVTNSDGVFLLKSDHPIPEVECSLVGYKSFRTKALEEPLTIGLKRENLTLQEASIISGNPKHIVEAALEHLYESYCTEPELLECFYRETLRKRSRYTYVAEAVSRIYKSKFDGTIFRDGAAIEKSRVLVSQRSSDTLSVVTLGGPALAVTNDILKNRDFLFNEYDLPHYDFEMELPAYIGDRLQFVIRMIPTREADYALFHCRLYIDRELLTFSRIEASLDMKDQVKAIRAILVRKPLGLRFFPEETSLVLNYRLHEGKTRLEYFRSTIRFACDWKKRLFRTHYTAINELVVTDVRPEAVPIPRKEQFSVKDCLAEKALEFRDPNFWKDYNIIEPSESLEHAIGRLRKGR